MLRRGVSRLWSAATRAKGVTVQCRPLHVGLTPISSRALLASPLPSLTAGFEALSIGPALQHRLSRPELQSAPLPLVQYQQVRSYTRRKKIDSIKLIRRRKMKKHKLKKLRKKMLFHNRHVLHRRRKKKEKAFLEVLTKYKQHGLDFDAEKYVDEQLELARKGGYQVDIFESFKKQKLGTS